NANVFYELGVRHTARPWSTVSIFAEGSRLPFDLSYLRSLPYTLGPGGAPTDVDKPRESLAGLLRKARETAADSPVVDSPLFQLLDGFPDLGHERTDVFREQVEYSERRKRELREARRQGVAAVRAVEDDLGDLDSLEAGVLVDLLLSYRAVSAWEAMVRLVEDRLPGVLAGTVLVREQYALALNRVKRRDDAEQVLTRLIEERGPSSETYGILGRVYKDQWEDAWKAGDSVLAPRRLKKAVEAYLKGFEADWRDAYPGVNAVTLMELREPRDERQAELLPVVRYAVERKIAKGSPDYWDFATRLELAVLADDREGAVDALGDALDHMREEWEGETTARNLRLIREARERRGEDAAWIADAERRLAPAAGGA
ncbi:MAG TPA: TRAFs-binding domain-containing protein, partial [Longimicrobiaceae bacterium]|nr:TRAFs-binding domain-containing protein [Longimicrobiaceae bacterium]